MHKPIKYAEKALTYAADAAWFVFDKFNQIGQNPGFVPAWSDKPLLKSWEKTKPPLGWPRDWRPGEICNPEDGQPFTLNGAWEFIARVLEARNDIAIETYT